MGIDGNYSSVAPERFQRVDLCTFLILTVFPATVRLKGIKHIERKARESLDGEGKFDYSFKKWIFMADERAREESNTARILYTSQFRLFTFLI